MNGDIAEDPLARSVLRHLATTHGKDDALGSFARTVLSGEATLRTAANNPWHSQGLAAASRRAQDEQARMPAEERAAIEQEAQRIRTNLQDQAPDEQAGQQP